MKFLILVVLVGVAAAYPMVADFVQNSLENQYRLKHLQIGDNAEEWSGQFEGDIILTQEQIEQINRNGRNGFLATTYRWMNKTVPYIISGDFSDDQKNYIRRGLDTLELLTCLKFVPRTSEIDYVDVVNRGEGSGCSSSVGRRGGRQQLNLQSYAIEAGCFRLATIMHEFIHAIGFYHMQSTFDRDDYVIIAYDNIQPGTENNFNKYTKDTVTNFGVSYDYSSVMHYSPNGFSINGKPTIVTKDPQGRIGQRTALSRKDIEKINRMYECELNE